jgi:hypothetical protein
MRSTSEPYIVSIQPVNADGIAGVYYEAAFADLPGLENLLGS